MLEGAVAYDQVKFSILKKNILYKQTKRRDPGEFLLCNQQGFFRYIYAQDCRYRMLDIHSESRPDPQPTSRIDDGFTCSGSRKL